MEDEENQLIDRHISGLLDDDDDVVVMDVFKKSSPVNSNNSPVRTAAAVMPTPWAQPPEPEEPEEPTDTSKSNIMWFTLKKLRCTQLASELSSEISYTRYTDMKDVPIPTTRGGVSGPKLFIGGLRYEMSAVDVARVLSHFSGFPVVPSNVEIFRRAEKSTGCAAVHVENEEAAKFLLDLSKRLLCEEFGVRMLSDAEEMRQYARRLSAEVKGPRHALVVELPRSRDGAARQYSVQGVPRQGGALPSTADSPPPPTHPTTIHVVRQVNMLPPPPQYTYTTTPHMVYTAQPYAAPTLFPSGVQYQTMAYPQAPMMYVMPVFAQPVPMHSLSNNTTTTSFLPNTISK
jgi:hypothetical protein